MKTLIAGLAGFAAITAAAPADGNPGAISSAPAATVTPSAVARAANDSTRREDRLRERYACVIILLPRRADLSGDIEEFLRARLHIDDITARNQLVQRVCVCEVKCLRVARCARDDDDAAGISARESFGEHNVERHSFAAQNFLTGLFDKSTHQNGVTREIAHADLELRAVEDAAPFQGG